MQNNYNQGNYPQQQGPYGQYPMMNPPQQQMGMQSRQVVYIEQPVIMQQGFPQPIIVNEGPLKKKGWGRLVDREGIYIRQKVDIAEVMTGCEQGNTYYVFPLGKDDDKKGKKLFKAKEKSSCFAKQCMSGACRPFKLKLNLEDDDEQLDNEPFLLLERPCKCTCLCCDRPEMTVHCVEDGQNDFIGRVKDLWSCCNIVLHLHDKNDTLKYIIEASCLQCGMHCSGPCDCCQNIDFDIKTPSGEVVSTLKKKSRGCVTAMVSDADNFILHFPSNASKEDKAVLMSAVLLLDYRYFEKRGGAEGNNEVL